MPASGGTPRQIWKPDGAANGYAHVWPQALPGGRSLLFTIWGQQRGTAVMTLGADKWQMVLPAPSFASAIYELAEPAKIGSIPPSNSRAQMQRLQTVSRRKCARYSRGVLDVSTLN